MENIDNLLIVAQEQLIDMRESCNPNLKKDIFRRSSLDRQTTIYFWISLHRRLRHDASSGRKDRSQWLQNWLLQFRRRLWNYRRVDYIADVHGFRATVRTNEPGVFPENPAHVKVRIDDSKNLDLPIQQSIKNGPQLDYSSHIFSRYNFSTNHNQDKGGYSNSPHRQPVRAVILSDVDLPNPIGYADSQRLNPKEFFSGPSIDPDFIFDDKIANTGYDNSPTFSLIPNPTRYPRRLRDSRTRRKQRYEYKIHTPKGYEKLS
ncbi:uncharacterized protein CEXT_202441 [Caerostris extrusa]|uniref:Uncharacterized protein n=1 Tax=Caerostris extrusa TaxID=172846 RepID=A0AAV4VZ53_CAEEX|nr:uncharacterized protein CEXT_202441 [Caerostris extrusa]